VLLLILQVSDTNPKKYWRGPIWINLNWILYNGLKDYEYVDIAARVKSDTFELLANWFSWYFDPRKSEYIEN
jgi:glycogen debranching enzyme